MGEAVIAAQITDHNERPGQSNGMQQAEASTRRLLSEALTKYHQSNVGSRIESVTERGNVYELSLFLQNGDHASTLTIARDDIGSASALDLVGPDIYSSISDRKAFGHRAALGGGILEGAAREATKEWTSNPNKAIADSAANFIVGAGLMAGVEAAPLATSAASAIGIGLGCANMVSALPAATRKMKTLQEMYDQSGQIDGTSALKQAHKAGDLVGADVYHAAYTFLTTGLASKIGFALGAQTSVNLEAIIAQAVKTLTQSTLKALHDLPAYPNFALAPGGLQPALAGKFSNTDWLAEQNTHPGVLKNAAVPHGDSNEIKSLPKAKATNIHPNPVSLPSVWSESLTGRFPHFEPNEIKIPDWALAGDNALQQKDLKNLPGLISAGDNGLPSKDLKSLSLPAWLTAGDKAWQSKDLKTLPGWLPLADNSVAGTHKILERLLHSLKANTDTCKKTALEENNKTTDKSILGDRIQDLFGRKEVIKSIERLQTGSANDTTHFKAICESGRVYGMKRALRFNDGVLKEKLMNELAVKLNAPNVSPVMEMPGLESIPPHKGQTVNITEWLQESKTLKELTLEDKAFICSNVASHSFFNQAGEWLSFSTLFGLADRHRGNWVWRPDTNQLLMIDLEDCFLRQTTKIGDLARIQSLCSEDPSIRQEQQKSFADGYKNMTNKYRQAQKEIDEALKQYPFAKPACISNDADIELNQYFSRRQL